VSHTLSARRAAAARAPLVRVFRRTYACGLLGVSLIAQSAQGAPLPATPAIDGAEAPHTHTHAAEPPVDGTPLSIHDAIQLALTDQPILRNRQAIIDAE
jgi:hypothetical protein